MKTRALPTVLALITGLALASIGPQQAQSNQPSNPAAAAPTPAPAAKAAANSAASAAGQDDPKTRHRKWRYQPQTKTVQITGEVVDSWCYASQVMGPGRGERHKACGLACAHGGVTIGLVDDQGTLYICAKHKAYTGCKELLTPYMAKRVKVSGWLAQKGGCNVLKIASVEEVKSTAPTAAAASSPEPTSKAVDKPPVARK